MEFKNVMNWYGKKSFSLSCLLTIWNQHMNENRKVVRLFLEGNKEEHE